MPNANATLSPAAATIGGGGVAAFSAADYARRLVEARRSGSSYASHGHANNSEVVDASISQPRVVHSERAASSGLSPYSPLPFDPREPLHSLSTAGSSGSSVNLTTITTRAGGHFAGSARTIAGLTSAAAAGAAVVSPFHDFPNTAGGAGGTTGVATHHRPASLASAFGAESAAPTSTHTIFVKNTPVKAAGGADYLPTGPQQQNSETVDRMMRRIQQMRAQMSSRQ
jgi:hypothetical protein